MNTFLVHNASRSRFNRTQRAQQPVHGGHKQYVLEGRRLLRNRPLIISEAELDKHLEELKAKHAQGLVSVTTGDGRPFDLTTRKVGELPPSSPPPNKRLDSAANDKPGGYVIPRFPGENVPPAEFTMPVDPPYAAMENPIAGLLPAVEEPPPPASVRPTSMAGSLALEIPTGVVTPPAYERPSNNNKKRGGR